MGRNQNNFIKRLLDVFDPAMHCPGIALDKIKK
jgi:hypothetical protein